MTCACVGPGFCVVFQRVQSPRMFAICHGSADGITAAESAAYRENWKRLAKSGDAKASPENRSPCQSLGRELRQQQCDSCSGKVMLKIFACDVRGECTVLRPLLGVACCGSCDRYRE